MSASYPVCFDLLTVRILSFAHLTSISFFFCCFYMICGHRVFDRSYVCVVSFEWNSAPPDQLPYIVPHSACICNGENSPGAKDSSVRPTPSTALAGLSISEAQRVSACLSLSTCLSAAPLCILVSFCSASPSKRRRLVLSLFELNSALSNLAALHHRYFLVGSPCSPSSRSPTLLC